MSGTMVVVEEAVVGLVFEIGDEIVEAVFVGLVIFPLIEQDSVQNWLAYIE